MDAIVVLAHQKGDQTMSGDNMGNAPEPEEKRLDLKLKNTPEHTKIIQDMVDTQEAMKPKHDTMLYADQPIVPKPEETMSEGECCKAEKIIFECNIDGTDIADRYDHTIQILEYGLIRINLGGRVITRSPEIIHNEAWNHRTDTEGENKTAEWYMQRIPTQYAADADETDIGGLKALYEWCVVEGHIPTAPKPEQGEECEKCGKLLVEHDFSEPCNTDHRDDEIAILRSQLGDAQSVLNGLQRDHGEELAEYHSQLEELEKGEGGYYYKDKYKAVNKVYLEGQKEIEELEGKLYYVSRQLKHKEEMLEGASKTITQLKDDMREEDKEVKE